ncbi:hypothetical protein Tco_0643368 [Tanacetum coccineum]
MRFRRKKATYDDVERFRMTSSLLVPYDPSINALRHKHQGTLLTMEVPMSSEEQALNDELLNAFEEEKRKIALEKGKESAHSTLTLSTANTPSQRTGNTPKAVNCCAQRKPLGLISYSEDADGLTVFTKQVYFGLAQTEAMRSPKVHHGNNLGLSIAITLGGLAQPKVNFSLMIKNGNAQYSREAIVRSTHSRAESSSKGCARYPTQVLSQARILQGTLTSKVLLKRMVGGIPQSPNDYTPTDESQTFGGDEGLLDLYALNREVRRLKKQNISQAKQIHKLKPTQYKQSKGESHGLTSNLCLIYEDFDATVVVTRNLENRGNETEADIIEEIRITSDVKMGDTEELDLERFKVLLDKVLDQSLPISCSYALSTSTNQLKLLTSKEKGKVNGLKPKKKNYSSSNQEALRLHDDEEVLRERFNHNRMQREREKDLSIIYIRLYIDYDKQFHQLGLDWILLGDLTTIIGRTSLTMYDDFRKNKKERNYKMETLRNLHRIHTIEFLEDGTMLHMLQKEDIRFQRALSDARSWYGS